MSDDHKASAATASMLQQPRQQEQTTIKSKEEVLPCLQGGWMQLWWTGFMQIAMCHASSQQHTV